MSAGRPLRDRRNNWNPQWLAYTRRIVTDMINHYGLQAEIDELVNVCWLKTLRYCKPDTPIQKLGPCIRQAVFNYAFGRKTSAKRKYAIKTNSFEDIPYNSEQLHRCEDRATPDYYRLPDIEWTVFLGILTRRTHQEIGDSVGRSREWVRMTHAQIKLLYEDRLDVA